MPPSPGLQRSFSAALGHPLTRALRPVVILPSWERAVLEHHALNHSQPARLPRSRAHLPPACAKWFVHNGDPAFALTPEDGRDDNDNDNDNQIEVLRSSELRTSFWADHESHTVPLEVTTRRRSAADGSLVEEFARVEAPVKVMLAYLARPPVPAPGDDDESSIYLAQCDLSSLPEALQLDVPVPGLLSRRSESPAAASAASPRSGIRGDIYASSLWLGRPPTYTPLHRDPNPNLFIQLAGQKTIRLLPPPIGDALYHDIMTTSLSGPRSAFSTAIRGEEMMAGPQKAAFHDAVWDDASGYAGLVREHGYETTLALGDALFTPQGWWHSVKGIGPGITASVNWWFR